MSCRLEGKGRRRWKRPRKGPRERRRKRLWWRTSPRPTREVDRGGCWGHAEDVGGTKSAATWWTKAGRIAAGGSCGRPVLEEPPREWDPGGLSSENQWNPREGEGTSGPKEGSRRAKTTEFRHSQPLERPAKGGVCGQGTWQERRSDHGEPRGRAGPAQDLHHP